MNVSMAPVTEVTIQKPAMAAHSVVSALPLDNFTKDTILDEDNLDDGLDLRLSEGDETEDCESKIL